VLVLATLLILLAVVAIFASQNAHMVSVSFIGWQFSWPLAGIVLLALAAGSLATFLVVLVRQVGLRLKIHDTSGRLRRAENDLQVTKSEVEKLRSELAAARAEVERSKVILSEKEQDLVALRAELAGRTPEDKKGGGPGGS